MKPLKQSKPKIFLLLCVGMMSWCGMWNLSVAMASPRCYQLSAKGLHLQAAYCFRRAANQIPKHSKDKFARGLRGNFLRNSAMSFLKATQQSKRVAVKAYRAEQTVQMIRRLLQENLCSDPSHCAQLKQEAQNIEASIPYKRLRVAVPPGKQARIIIRGYQFYATHNIDKPWTRKVRPGRYSIEYQYPTEKPRQYKVVVRHHQRQKKAVVMVVLPPPQPVLSRSAVASLPRTTQQQTKVSPSPKEKSRLANLGKNKQSKVPGKAKTLAKKTKLAVAKRAIPPLRQAPPIVKKPSMVGPLVLLGVGGAAMAAGGILLGMGYSGAQQLQQETDALRNQSSSRSQADQIASAKAGQSAGSVLEKYSSLETQTTTGWVVASSGAVMGVASMVWLLMQRTSNKKPDPQSQTLFKSKASH